jgi:hypothetical protein|tara:strand:- start:6405 stop:6551 length:147 start_codon:yes stop_codon:yes gene_type:complete
MILFKWLSEFLHDPDPTDYYGDIKISIVFIMTNVVMIAFFLFVIWLIK